MVIVREPGVDDEEDALTDVGAARELEAALWGVKWRMRTRRKARPGAQIKICLW